MLRVEKIITKEEFDRLENVWNLLLEKSTSNTITLTFEWLSTWWEVFGAERDLYILLVRDGEELIGIAPFLKRAVQRYGLLPFRRIEFLASGEEEADEICSDYLDFIFQRGREAEALEAVMNYLHEEDRDWDEMLLTDVNGESVNLPLLKSFCDRNGRDLQTVKDEIAIYLPLDKSWDELLKSVKKPFRYKINKDRRTFAEFGGETCIIDTLEDFETGFIALIDLHQARWQSRGQPGVFASERFTRFHRLLAPKVIQKGWLKIFVALKEDAPISALYNFFHNHKVHSYQSGFVAEGSGLHSPVIMLRSFAVEHAIDNNFAEFDFLKGKEGSYKFDWNPQTRSILQLRLAQSQTKEALYKTTSKVLDGLRSIRRGLRNTAAFVGTVAISLEDVQ